MNKQKERFFLKFFDTSLPQDKVINSLFLCVNKFSNIFLKFIFISEEKKLIVSAKHVAWYVSANQKRVLMCEKNLLIFQLEKTLLS